MTDTEKIVSDILAKQAATGPTGEVSDIWFALHEYVPKEWWDGFMFMGSHKGAKIIVPASDITTRTRPGDLKYLTWTTYPGTIYEYKHGITRKPLDIDEEGNFYNFYGGVDPYGFIRWRSKDAAYDYVFGDLDRMGATKETAYDEAYRCKRDAAIAKAGYTSIGMSPGKVTMQRGGVREERDIPVEVQISEELRKKRRR